MNDELKIDDNNRNVLGAVTNDANEFIRNLLVNPITGALLVEADILSTNTDIGSTILGGTEGSVLFLDIGSTLAQDNTHFFYDPTSHELALGHNSPSATLDVVGTFQYIDGNQSNGFVLTSDSQGNATWGNLAVNTTFITNLANNNTFVNDLISNTTFTTTLAQDTNFYTTLANNTNFTTLLNGLVAVAVDGVTITGDGTTGNPLTAVASGSGTVTSVSIVSANGLAGTVATASTTPAITLRTTVTGLLQGNGTAISAATTTGSGSVVLATSPTLITPALGIPTSVTLTNGTGLPIISGTTGTLSVARGGTGDTTLVAHGVLIGNGTGAVAVTGTGTAGQVLTSNGASSDPTFQTLTASTKLFLQTTTYTAPADTSEHTVASFTVPGGVLNTNNAIKVLIKNIQLTNSNYTATFRFKYGTTTVATFVLNANVTLGSVGFMDIVFAADGATNAQVLEGNATYESSSAARTALCPITSGTATEDSTTNQTFQITLQNSVGQTPTVGLILAQIIS